jgi:hypothetical protein
MFVEFARELPAYCGPDGLPLSWQHFMAGYDELTKLFARDKLRAADANAAARIGDQAKWEAWVHDQRIIGDV